MPARPITISIPLRSLLSSSLFLFAAWPSIHWYVRRTGDKSDEPLGLIALAVLLCALLLRRREVQLFPATLGAGALVIIVLQYGGLHFPPLLMAAGLLVVLLGALRVRLGQAGLAALAALSLPLMASLDFYAGGPMRLAAAEMARWILNLAGLGVLREGTLLQDGTRLVGVDPPCAGVRMLWTCLLVAAIVATQARLSWLKTGLLTTLTLAMVVVGNALRATALFFPESGRVHWSGLAHEGVGLVFHGVILVLIFKAGRWLEGQNGRGFTWLMLKPETWRAAMRPALVVVAVALASTAIFAAVRGITPASPATSATSPSWPATWNGVPLHSLPLSEREQRFATTFPGALARFQWGDAEVILRRVERPTRLLHSSAGCLQASGYRVSPRPLWRDEDGGVWGCYEAAHGATRYQIRERIMSLKDESNPSSYTDVSSWYWGALWHPEQGPWLAMTVIEERGMELAQTTPSLVGAP